ncbi:MAG: DUF927 domain-containing protein [Caulobacteraceae bacterium]|nr:DUF927 domain-containing protein [Caulobacteraceae bacterium]
MSAKELLSAVLSPDGLYCIVGLKKGGGVRQKFFASLDECEAEIAYLLQHNHDVYFACSKYEKSTTRTRDNVKTIKAFWLDIDCGPAKTYKDRDEGDKALKEFCQKLKLPEPTLVNSGRGLHAYWVLTEGITKEEWLPVANRLKALCDEFGLDADHSRTADCASILRVPGTLNLKDDPPNPVEMVSMGGDVTYADFKDTLGVLVPPPGYSVPKQELNELTKHLAGNQENWFKEIVRRTIKGEGCAQIETIMVNQDTVDYNLWRAGLSVAWACEDRDEAIHKISEGHPDYSFENTIRKAADTGGPQRCETFAKWNPEGCVGCPHQGKIPGPIALGKKVIRAAPKAAPEKTETKDAEDTYPAYPSPYFRGKNGGVYKFVDEKEVCVYQHDLYVVKRLKDPQKGETIWLRLHLPRDGVKEFALPLTELLTKEKLRERLAWHGVSALQDQMNNIMYYINSFVNELQYKTEVEVMRMQFGWADKDTKFIVGEQEIMAGKIRYSPPSYITSSIAETLKPCGSLEEWKSVINTYDREGFEPHAFGFFTAFGSPLIKHLNLKGAVINLINNRSGTGKTTVALAMHSVWGHPEETMLIAKDTQNVKLHRLGIMGNLPIACDEITNIAPEDASDFLYAVSQGRARGRLKSNENAERLNTAKWALICLTTSNASIYDKLTSIKSSPDGEMMRLIEYQIPEIDLISKEEAGQIFPKLYQNYGHAGRIYGQWLVGNLEEAIEMVKATQAALDAQVNFSNRERFWSGVAACNIAGALIAEKLGLIDIDIKRVFKWVVQEFKRMRKEIKPPATNQASVITEFLDSHRGSILVINGDADKRTGMEQLPILEPKFELVVRWEPDTNLLFINASKLRKYCSDRQITLKDILSALAVDGSYGGVVKKRMGKGTKIPGAGTDAHVFDCSKGDFIDVSGYTQALQNSKDEDTQP